MKKLALSVLGLGLLSSVAIAQTDPKFEYKKEEDVKAVAGVEWHAAAEAGLLLTAGNAETTTLTAGLKASRQSGKNKLELFGAAAYAKAQTRIAIDDNNNGTIGPGEFSEDSKVTAETYEGKLRYDRFLTDSNSLFVAALAKRDIPAGKELVLGAQAGYSRRLYKSERHEAVGEFGYDFASENPTAAAAKTLSIHSARLFLGYKGQMTETSSLDGSVEALLNLNKYDTPTGEATIGKDTRINAAANVTSKVGANLSFNFGLQAKYDNLPSVFTLAKGQTFDAGFVQPASKLDTIFKASLIYSFM